jgi:hypothetical protein
MIEPRQQADGRRAVHARADVEAPRQRLDQDAGTVRTA